LLRGAVADPARMSDRLIARYLAPYVGSDGVGQLLQLAGAVEMIEEEQPSIRDVRAPTLVVHGAADRWTTPAIVGSFPLRLPRTTTTIETMPGVGRLIAEDAPEALTALLRGWIENETDPAGTAFDAGVSGENSVESSQRNV
jgi:pimeloyl-ACP methyl ester carboxylesterase